MSITASKLYDYLQCPHRVWRDEHGPQEEKEQEVNAFVQLLWDRGVAYEQEQLALAGEVVNIKEVSFEDRSARTLEAMKSGAKIIYQGVLRVDNLLGIPDFLRRQGDGTYIPIDVKSGMGVEGTDEEDGEGEKLKKTYAVQLALYADALIRLGFAKERKGIILDIRRTEVSYDLMLSQGPRTPETYWELYERTKQSVAVLLLNEARNEPAMVGVCKLCPWYGSCKRWVENSDDLTGLFYVGRSVRDSLVDSGASTITALTAVDIAELLDRKAKDKTFLKGLGEKKLQSAVSRAKILRIRKEPVLYENIDFPLVTHELFFDIEDDPTREFVYMHGVYERSPSGERYVDFTAREFSEEAEREAWAAFWNYIRSLPKDSFAVYYYSKHERTTYRKMREKYPDVVTEEELERFFNPQTAIDLYGDVVYKKTDWPLGSYSIKSLAQYLGFKWRDETPSGALSIQWFSEYLDKKDEAMMERIRLYNEDDCKATMILKDALVEMNKNRKKIAG